MYIDGNTGEPLYMRLLCFFSVSIMSQRMPSSLKFLSYECPTAVLQGARHGEEDGQGAERAQARGQAV